MLLSKVQGWQIIMNPLLATKSTHRLTWTELGLMGIFGMGLMLGVLKRYLPISDSLVTLTYDGLCFGVLGYVILRRLRRPSRLPFTGIISLLLLFCGYALLTVFNPNVSSFSRGLLGWRFMVSGLLFFMLGFYAFNDIHRIWKILKYFWIITGISAIYGIIQLLRGYTPVELSWIEQLPATMKIAGTGSYRLMSSFGSAVDFSAVLVLAMASLGGVLLVRKEQSIWRLCLYGLMAIALLFTYVRAAWIALLFGGIFLLLVYFWHIRLVRLLFFPLITIIVLGIGLLLWGMTLIASDIPNAALQERIGSLSNPLQDKSMLDRFDNWGEAWKVVEEHPLGIGIGMTGAASIKYSDNSGLSLITLDNSYLEILVTTGWPGLFLFVILVLTLVTKLVLLPGHLREDSRLLAICLGSSVIAYLVIMFFGEYIELNPARTIVWILGGMALSLSRIQKLSST